jgi:hypothetical protein
MTTDKNSEEKRRKAIEDAEKAKRSLQQAAQNEELSDDARKLAEQLVREIQEKLDGVQPSDLITCPNCGLKKHPKGMCVGCGK